MACRLRRAAPTSWEAPVRRFAHSRHQARPEAGTQRTGQVVRFEPHALWIIDDNGRIGVKPGERRHLIVDAAENFGKPDWQVARNER